MYNTVNITFFRRPLIVDDFIAIMQFIFGLMKVIILKYLFLRNKCKCLFIARIN